MKKNIGILVLVALCLALVGCDVKSVLPGTTWKVSEDVTKENITVKDAGGNVISVKDMFTEFSFDFEVTFNKDKTGTRIVKNPKVTLASGYVTDANGLALKKLFENTLNNVALPFNWYGSSKQILFINGDEAGTLEKNVLTLNSVAVQRALSIPIVLNLTK